MNKEFTFEQLPQAVTMLTHEVSELKRLLIEKQATSTLQSQERPLLIEQAADFLGISKPTLYSKTSRNEIPHLKRGKRLYFLLSDLMEYLKAGRKMSNAEIEAEADQYLVKPKKG